MINSQLLDAVVRAHLPNVGNIRDAMEVREGAKQAIIDRADPINFSLAGLVVGKTAVFLVSMAVISFFIL